MSKTTIDRELRDEVIEFLKVVSTTGDNLELRRASFGLVARMKPQRVRKTRAEYLTQNGVTN